MLVLGWGLLHSVKLVIICGSAVAGSGLISASWLRLLIMAVAGELSPLVGLVAPLVSVALVTSLYGVSRIDFEDLF